MKEQWRPCFDGVYSVSNLGRVRREVSRTSGRAGSILHQCEWHGYHYVKLCDCSRIERLAVHQLVAAAFLGACPIGHEVNHKNTRKGDNRSSNLEYLTHADNVRHAARLGLLRGSGVCGERCGAAKLTESKVRQIRTLRHEGRTLVELGRRFGVSWRTISLVATRRTWAHVREVA